MASPVGGVDEPTESCRSAKYDADAALTAVAQGKESWGLLFWIALMTGAEREAIIARWRELVTDATRAAVITLVTRIPSTRFKDCLPVRCATTVGAMSRTMKSATQRS